MTALNLSDVPSFCSHEHWGLVRRFPQNEYPGGLRSNYVAGAVSDSRTGLLSILDAPSLHGSWTDNSDRFAGWRDLSLAKARATLRDILPEFELTGGYQCLRRGILALHGYDVSDDDPGVWAAADASIARRYAEYFRWNREGMDKANLAGLIRAVEPEFYVQEDSPKLALEEAGYTHTVLRIECLMAFWPATNAKTTDPKLRHDHWGRLAEERRERLAEITGITPGDAASYREFIGRIFDIAAAKKAVGIKQMQAYNRPLHYEPREDGDVTWSGDLTAGEVRVFQDWVMHEVCRQTHERGWTHQLHVGTHNLPESSPLPLQALARRYPRMKIAMLHCWPFVDEAGWLVKHQPNIYIDTCWLPILSPAFYRQAMTQWLNYAPLDKIMCGHDAHSVEEAAGSAIFKREILAQLLDEDHQRVAVDLLYNNAVAVYGVGKHGFGISS